MIDGENGDEIGAHGSADFRSDAASNERSEVASDSSSVGNFETVSDSQTGLNLGDDMGDNMDDDDGLQSDKNAPLSDAERMRLQRRRYRQMSDLAASLGLHEEAHIETLRLLDDLLPDGDRMSSGEDVVERLSSVLGEFKNRPPRLLFSHPTRSPIDITDADARFRNDRVLEDMSSSEEELYRALLVNEHLLYSYEQKALEHENLRRFLLAESVRRSTLVEQWRHLLPKYTLPIFSMMHAAGMQWKHLRLNGAVFNRIRDVLLEFAENGASKADLIEAAKRTEDQFLLALKDEYPSRGTGNVVSNQNVGDLVGEDDPASSSDASPSLDISACRKRIGMALVDAREEWTDLISMEPGDCDQADIDDAKMMVDRLMALEALGAGLTPDGLVVFVSIEEFFERVSMIEKRNEHTLSQPVSGLSDTYDGTLDEAPDQADDQADDLTKAGVDGDLEHEPSGKPEGDHIDDGDIHPFAEAHTNENSDSPISSDTAADGYADPTAETASDTTADTVNLPIAASTEDSSGSIPARQDDLFPNAEQAAETDPTSPHFDCARDPQSDLLFSSAWVKKWPQDNIDLEAMLLDLPRGQGLSRSTSKDSFGAFAGFSRSIEPAPYSFMGLRRQVDLSSVPVKGPIDPRFWARFEMPEGRWQISMIKGPSPIFGQPHLAMLPPHADLAWYGRMLSWQENRLHHLTNYGNLAEPGLLSTKGNPQVLADVFAKVAKIGLKRLVSSAPGHYLATGNSEKKVALAATHLSRWWIFVLLIRHDQEMFETSFKRDFFLGVEGPDFVLDADGNPDFGTQAECSHFIIHDARGLDAAYNAVWERPYMLNAGLPGRRLDEV